MSNIFPQIFPPKLLKAMLRQIKNIRLYEGILYQHSFPFLSSSSLFFFNQPYQSHCSHHAGYVGDIQNRHEKHSSKKFLAFKCLSNYPTNLSVGSDLPRIVSEAEINKIKRPFIFVPRISLSLSIQSTFFVFYFYFYYITILPCRNATNSK